MAGRGTDIALGEGVIEAEDFSEVGTERHESRRIGQPVMVDQVVKVIQEGTKFYLS